MRRILFAAVWTVFASLVLPAIAQTSTSAGAATPAPPPITAPGSPIPAQASVASTAKTAMTRLRALADGGDAAAAYVLARRLLVPTAAGSDISDGVEYLKRAADAKIVEAMNLLADILKVGSFGQNIDIGRAFALYQAGSDAGDLSARRNLAALMLDAEGGLAEAARATTLLTEAADGGDIIASNMLANLHSVGRGVPPNAEKALDFAYRGIVANHPAAFTNLADLYRAGIAGGPPAPDLAFLLYGEAAKLGDRNAPKRLADMYIRGEGVPADEAKGVALLEAAATSGDAAALITLGDWYSRGELAPVDAERAIEFYRRAAEAGLPLGLAKIGDLYRTGVRGLAADVEIAVDYYERAVALNNNVARRTLATMYLDGNGVRANPDRGAELLRDAALSGDASAALSLAVIYSRNEPYLADFEQASQYYKLAVAAGSRNANVRMGVALLEGPLAAGHGSFGLSLLVEGARNRIPGAAVELARLQLAGKVPDQGLEGAIELLKSHADSGDADALRFLLELYRDGYGLLLRPDPQAAALLLENAAPNLDPRVVAYEKVLLASSTRPNASKLEAIWQDFSILDRANGISLLQKLRRMNAGIYVYLVQRRLGEFGLYTGTADGILDNSTIAAFRAACSEADASSICDSGPLTTETGAVISAFLYTPR
jgi:TPR repeat protein